jgi:hypothetical protein
MDIIFFKPEDNPSHCIQKMHMTFIKSKDGQKAYIKKP